ncbi:MAG: Xaa-Pro peptidase family protein [Acidobacteriia bacterium]|nr:Xaa-Pro peptidase family protein [Terriglobia bacterium]
MKRSNPIRQLQKNLEELKLDAILISHRPNIFYLTGFTGSSAALLVFRHSAVFLTDGRYTEQAAREVKDVRIRWARDGLMPEAASVASKHGARRVAFESRHITHDMYLWLRRALRSKSQLVPCIDWVEELRAVKTSEEVAKIRASLRTVMAAFEETLPVVRPGIRERDLSAELEYRMKRHGAQKVSFDLIVASGPRSALPHGIASERRVRRNEFLVFDLGAILRGYSSDFTRTVYVGRPSARAREIYKTVAESQASAIAGIGAGVPAAQIDYLARNVIERKGYGRNFVHSTGHGIGVEVHEAPLIGTRSTAILRAGQVITVEPGIYIPHFGGVRIEDIVVVGDRGCHNLTETTREFITL